MRLSLLLRLHRNDGLARVCHPFGRAVHISHVRASSSKNNALIISEGRYYSSFGENASVTDFVIPDRHLQRVKLEMTGVTK